MIKSPKKHHIAIDYKWTIKKQEERTNWNIQTAKAKKKKTLKIKNVYTKK